MKKPFSFTKGRFIGFVCCVLIPVMVMGLGIAMLTKGVQFNFGFAFTYIMVPLIAAGLLALCIFSGCRTVYKVILSGLILILFAVSFYFFFLVTGFVQVKHYEGAEVSRQYAAVSDDDLQMFSLSEIGQPVNIECYNIFQFVFTFSWETDYLICRYAPEEYEAQKAALDEKYVFQAQTITEDNSNCEPSAQVGTYDFHMLSIEEYDLNYPQQVVLIGYSDDTQEIVYASYYDIDLNYISSLQDFIVGECGWKYIR